MTSLRLTDIIALGFMTFALFIGAGNIIFPPIVAQQAGEHVWLAAAGFLLTGVGLPLLTIIALSRTQGSLARLSAPLGKYTSLIFAVICYLAVGPLFATPRTATVSYEIGIAPYFVDAPYGLWFYSSCYFILVTVISLYPNKLLDTIGYVLAPLKILALIFLGVTALILPATSTAPPVGKYIEQPFSQGFVSGYLTMDTLAALVFGIVIIQAITSRGVSDKSLITRYAIIAGCIAGVGLTFVYVSLFKLGLSSHTIIPNAENGAVILHAYVAHAYGDIGAIFLTLLICITCMVTAIGLTCACAEYFHRITRISYKLLVLVLSGSAFLVSNLGLTKLIAVSQPVLTTIYPPAIIVIILSFFTPYMQHPQRIVAPVAAVAAFFGILDALQTSSIQQQNWILLMQNIPLSEHGLAWVLPCLIVFGVLILFERKSIKNKS